MPKGKKDHIYAFVNTDSNRVKGILEGRDLNGLETMRTHYGSTDYFKLDKKIIPITNLDANTGPGIRRGWGLDFNPWSVIHGEINHKDINLIVGRLMHAGFSVDISQDGIVENHKQNQGDK